MEKIGLDKILSKEFPSIKEKEIAENLIEIIWGRVTGLTRTQLKNSLITILLEKANTNLDEIISKLVKLNLIENIEVETTLKVIRKKQ